MSGAHGRAAGRRTEHLFQLDLAESLNEAYAWVTRIQVAQFTGILSRMREEHREAMAMRALHAFALRRPVHELVFRDAGLVEPLRERDGVRGVEVEDAETDHGSLPTEGRNQGNPQDTRCGRERHC